jgi:hypothetical protein
MKARAVDELDGCHLRPPNGGMARNVTDPSKIIHVRETPAAPHRRVERPDKTSPTPHRKAADGWIKCGGSKSQSETHCDKPSRPTPSSRSQFDRLESLPHSNPSDRFGLQKREEIWVAPSTGTQFTTTTCPLPPGHGTHVYDRHYASSFEPNVPSEAFWIRKSVPTGFADYGLRPKDRARVFDTRLNEIEKSIGVKARYELDEPVYPRVGKTGWDPTVGVFMDRDGAKDLGWIEDVGKNEGATEDEFQCHQVDYDIGDRVRGLEVKDDGMPPGVSESTALPGMDGTDEFDESSDDTSSQEIAGKETQPFREPFHPQHPHSSPKSVLATDVYKPLPARRTIVLSTLPEDCTLGSVLRALANSGVIQNISFSKEDYTSSITFLHHFTAERIAKYNTLEIPMDKSTTYRVRITLSAALTSPTEYCENTRILYLGPAPIDYYLAAYIEYKGKGKKETLVDYIWEVIGQAASHPEQVLDVTMQARNGAVRAIATFASIDCAIETRKALWKLRSFRGVEITFGHDPCQGATEVESLNKLQVAEKRKSEQFVPSQRWSSLKGQKKELKKKMSEVGDGRRGGGEFKFEENVPEWVNAG